jgi:hypothetical protein
MLKKNVKYVQNKDSIDSFLCRESVFKPDIVFTENVQNLQTSFTAITHLAQGLYFNALPTLKIENSLIYQQCPRWKEFILPLKTFVRNKASRCRRLE